MNILKSIQGPNVWNSSGDINKFFCSFSEAAAYEIERYISSMDFLKNIPSISEIEKISVERAKLPLFTKELQDFKKEVDFGVRLQIVRAISGLDIVGGMILSWLIANTLGELYKQNEKGDLLYLVTDRGGRMEKGARYSQTRQGGSYHTDGVNQKTPYEYLVFYTAASALIGGESIFISGATVYNYLLENAPKALEILSQDFQWEFKGLKTNEFYQEPIFKFSDEEVQWRYLRNYVEEAALKKGIEFGREVVWAMDALDSAMDSTEHQFRYNLKPGETLLAKDTQILHGRTCFVDAADSILIDDYLKDRNLTNPVRRSCLRYWSH